MQKPFLRIEIDDDAGETEGGEPIRFVADILSLPPAMEASLIASYHQGTTDEHTPAFSRMGAVAVNDGRITIRPLAYRYLLKRGIITPPSKGEQWQTASGAVYTFSRWEAGRAIMVADDGSERCLMFAIAIATGWRPYLPTCEQCQLPPPPMSITPTTGRGASA